MISYNAGSYGKMLGNITEKSLRIADICTHQCTGCACNCRCTCSGGFVTDMEWEKM